MRKNEGTGRAETLCARTLAPLTALGLGRSTQPHSLSGGSASSCPAPVLSWNWTSSLENWKKSQHCSFFRSFVLGICISPYGKLPLKAAGVCAHWAGSGTKGETGPGEGRGGGIASDGHSAGAKGRVRAFTIDLEEGERRSQKYKSSGEFLRDVNLPLFKHG